MSDSPEKHIPCPLCSSPLDFSLGIDSGFVDCPACKRRINVERYFWVVKGIGTSGKQELRCPHCYKLFCEGDYSDRPQVFKCKNCKQFSVFQRVF